MYQGASDHMLGAREDIVLMDEAWGIDFEAEVAVITGDVPMGTVAADARRHIRLLMLVNDVSLRNLIPNELAKGFGFFQSKPASAFSPVAVTPDELGDAWRDGKVHLPLVTHFNGELFGRPDAGTDMTFNFDTLVAHVAKTRELEAGSIVGSGTVSNKENGGPGRPAAAGERGYACIAEQRTVENDPPGQGVDPVHDASATASASRCSTRLAGASSRHRPEVAARAVIPQTALRATSSAPPSWPRFAISSRSPRSSRARIFPLLSPGS
jgi:fumarylacetoacetate (FAA) hydrolase